MEFEEKIMETKNNYLVRQGEETSVVLEMCRPVGDALNMI
jgi:hypothetical protein